MPIKRPEDFTKEALKVLGETKITEAEADILIKDYWNRFFNFVDTTKHSTLYAYNFGTIKTSLKKVKRTIQSTKISLRCYKKNNNKEMIEHCENKLINLMPILERMENEDNTKRLKKKAKGYPKYS